jgi:hypothetical protein
MAAFSVVGFGVFFLVSLAIGLRLVAAATRSHQAPELLIGIGILGIGPTGMGCMLAAALLHSFGFEAARVPTAVALLAIATGSVASCVFNWRVFRPDSAVARGWVFASALLFGIAFGLEMGTTGFGSPLQLGPGGTATSALCTANLLWGATESLLYYALMRRRLRLGLADPLVTNRFLLWGLGIGAAGVGSLLSVTVQVVSGLSMSELPALTLSNSLFGLASALLMWVAFVPPAAWRRYILGSRAV